MANRQLNVALSDVVKPQMINKDNLTLAQGVLGAARAIQNSPTQQKFLDFISRIPEIKPGVFSSNSQVVFDTPLEKFAEHFRLGQTPVERAIVSQSREKVGVNNTV